MGRVTTRRPVLRITADRATRRPDTLAVEEPLEIRVGGESLTITMRTPGHDVDLVHGFLLAEGMIGSREDIAAVRYCDGVDESGANTYNVLDVASRPASPSPKGRGDAHSRRPPRAGCAGRTRSTRCARARDIH